MNTQHTPGPWQPYLGNTRWCVETVAHPATLTAIVYAGQDASCTNSTEQGANARLIAAAPELLEMLQTLADHCDGLAIDLGHVDPAELKPGTVKALDATIDAARAAIAKATGKA